MCKLPSVLLDKSDCQTMANRRLCVYTCMCVGEWLHGCARVCVCLYVCVFVCACMCARVCVMCVHVHVCGGWGWVGHVKMCFITIYNYSNSFTVHISLPHHINTCVHSTDPPTLSDLIEHVGSSCSTKWYNLGLRLGVNTHTLDQIEEDCQRKSNEACRKIFQHS